MRPSFGCCYSGARECQMQRRPGFQALSLSSVMFIPATLRAYDRLRECFVSHSMVMSMFSTFLQEMQ